MGLRGRAPIVKEQELRHLVPSRVEVGAFEDVEVPDQAQVDEASIAEVDREPTEGWLWLVQRKRLASRRALTIMVRVRRPGAEESEDLRLVLLCDGGAGGAGG